MTLAKPIPASVFDRLYVDPTSPSGLRWRHDVYTGFGKARLLLRAGQVAGSKNDQNRWMVMYSENGVRRNLRCSRVIAYMTSGLDSLHEVVDHKNGSCDDNDSDNLHQVSQTDNMRNIQKGSGPFGLLGVDKAKDKYQPSIRIDSGRKVRLGTYDDPWLCHKIYAAARVYLKREPCQCCLHEPVYELSVKQKSKLNGVIEPKTVALVCSKGHDWAVHARIIPGTGKRCCKECVRIRQQKK